MLPNEFRSKCIQMQRALQGLGYFIQTQHDFKMTYFTFITNDGSMTIWNDPNGEPVYTPYLDLTVREKFMGEVEVL